MQLWEFVQKGYKNHDFLLFTIIYPKINMIVVKTICLGNNLPMHIRENLDFPRQKLRQLSSVEANFEDWVYKVVLDHTENFTECVKCTNN